LKNILTSKQKQNLVKEIPSGPFSRLRQSISFIKDNLIKILAKGGKKETEFK